MGRRDFGEIVKVGDAVWKHENPDTKMETPNMVYEQMEKFWDEWIKENKPFAQFVEELIIK